MFGGYDFKIKMNFGLKCSAYFMEANTSRRCENGAYRFDFKKEAFNCCDT